MKISDLKECIKLAQTLNFTQTARSLYITQPVLSKHISALEQELGIQLFIRSQHGISLTEIGKTFIKDAAEMVAKHDQMIESIKRAQAGKGTSLTLGYLLGTSKKILPPAVSRFAKIRPDVTLSFVALEIDGVIDALETGRTDFCITTSFNNLNFPSARYSWEPLYSDGFAVIVPKSHRLACKESVRAADLAGEHVLLSAPSFMKEDQERILEMIDAVRSKLYIHKVIFDLNSLELLLECGRYTTVSFTHLMNFLPDSFAFIPLLEASDQKFDVGVVWKRDKENQAITDFVTILKEQVQLQGMKE